MAGLFSYKCTTCGQVHEGSPSVAFKAPDSYLEQSPEVRNGGKLDDDLCVYEDEDGFHFFVRTTLEIPIIGYKDGFLWGVWSSVSEKSFKRYVETWEDPDPDDVYFGHLCNHLPGYENTFALKANINVRTGGARPVMSLHESTHPLSEDFEYGIHPGRAQELAELCLHKK